MIATSLYILACTTRNRLRRWVARLKEPRYLIALIAGGLYLYGIFGAQARRRTRERSASAPMADLLAEQFPALTVAAPVLAGVGLLTVAAASWLFPGTGGLIDFTRAEGQFLFTAPVTTRKLLVYRLIRSQIGLLFGPLVFAAFVPFGSDPQRIRMALTMWVVLFTARVYFSAVALARTRLRKGEPRSLAARLPLALTVGPFALVAVQLGKALLGSPLAGFNDAMTRVGEVSVQPGVSVALWPFRALVAPAFASSWTEFALALGSALAVSAVVTAWLLFNAPAFDDVIRNVSEQRVDRPAKRQTAYRARNIWWKLAPTGRAEIAFAWKSALQTFRIAEVRVLIRLSVVFVWIAFAASMQNSAAAALGAAAAIGAMICTVFGPLILRLDLRQDLQHLEVMKTWPVRAAQLVRGEMLWPALMLSTIVWGLIVTAFSLSAATFTTMSFATRASIAMAFGLIAPALIAAQLTVHNTVALMFPAWISFGNWRARGVDAMGQRLIVIGGTMLLVTLSAVPGALLGGIVWLAFNRFMGAAALVPAAAVCAVAMGVEVLLATEAIGPAYERLDLTAVERGTD